MKSKILRFTTALSLLAALAVPVQLAAQNRAKQDQPHQPHHYQIVDLGSTFGGPQSYFVPASGQDIAGSAVLNRDGTAVAFADTSMPEPFPAYGFTGDGYVAHAFMAGSSGVLTDLGALPGGGSSAPIWISANGLIAGLSENGQTDPLFAGFPEMHAVLWQQGQIMDLGTLPEGGYQSEANAVNSAGQVVGSALNTVPDANSMAAANYWYFGLPYGYQQRAFLWDTQKGMRDLGTLPGGTDAEALLINERGQVVGNSYSGSAPSAVCPPLTLGAFIWDKKNGMRDLGGFGGTCTGVAGLNNHGQVVGQSFRTGDQSAAAFLWENGSIHELRGSLGGHFTGTFALNEQGQAVGYGTLPGDSTFHATLWKSLKSITDLGAVGADPCSYAAAINAKMQVVGASTPACDDFDDIARAFLWEDGSLFDLNSLVPPASALYLKLTYAINDSGEIAGTGVDASGNEHAFLAIPCDKQHPGIEGCDYSLVDATVAKQSPAPRYVPSGTQPQSRRTNRRHLPGLVGATIGTASAGPDVLPSSCTGGNGMTNDLLDGVGIGVAEAPQSCIRLGQACFGPGPNRCCPAPFPHHSFCTNRKGWGKCAMS
jgi:probable HAF family extracellular repeat protein